LARERGTPISGEFGRTMARLQNSRFRILARRSRSKIPKERPNELGMQPRRTKKIGLGIYRTQIRPSDHDIVTILGQSIDIAEYPYMNARYARA